MSPVCVCVCVSARQATLCARMIYGIQDIVFVSLLLTVHMYMVGHKSELQVHSTIVPFGDVAKTSQYLVCPLSSGSASLRTENFDTKRRSVLDIFK